MIDKLLKEPCKNAVQNFMIYLIEINNLIGDIFKDNKSALSLTDEEKHKYKNVVHCKMCKCKFTGFFRTVKNY